jgi:hypothetical protein
MNKNKKIKSEFQDFEVGGFWSFQDALGDHVLQDKDTILVRWPEGDKEHTVIVKSAPYITASDHGHPYSCPQTHAFISCILHGKNILIRVTDLNCKAKLLKTTVEYQGHLYEQLYE